MRDKKEEKTNGLEKRRRPICCPKCGTRLMDAVSGTKIQYITPMKCRYPDFIIKCGHCGIEIGVITIK